MRIPQAGDRVGPFTVESSRVEHHPHGAGRYDYSVEIVVGGKGGVAGVRKAFKSLLTAGHSYFSAYGNPYQLGFAGFDVVSLGEKRYRIEAVGIGNRIDLRRELTRFVTYLDREGIELGDSTIDRYLEDYQRDVHRKHPSIEY